MSYVDQEPVSLMQKIRGKKKIWTNLTHMKKLVWTSFSEQILLGSWLTLQERPGTQKKKSCELSEKVRANAVFLGTSGFWVGFWASEFLQPVASGISVARTLGVPKSQFSEQVEIVKVARLQSNWHEIFLLSYEFSCKKCSEVFPENLEPFFCGPEKFHQIPVKFPYTKGKTKTHRRAAGVQGEEIDMLGRGDACSVISAVRYTHYPTISTDMLERVRNRDTGVCNNEATCCVDQLE